MVNYARLHDLNPELCQDEGFSITCKAKFDIPWTCLEAAFNKDTNTLMWVNPESYGKYLILPDSGNTPDDDKPVTEFNIFGTCPSSSSDVLPTAAPTIDAREETRSGLAARISTSKKMRHVLEVLC